MTETPPPLSSSPAPKKRNWLLIGCLGAVVLFVLLLGLVVGGGWFFLQGKLAHYTATAPLELPKSALSSGDQSRLQVKLDEIYSAFQQGRAVELELTPAELNASLAESTELKDRVWIDIQDGKLRGKVSLPLDGIGLDMLKGRWLNGDATLQLTGGHGQVRLSIDTLTVNGQALPAQLLDALRQENLVGSAAQDRQVAQYLERIETVVVEGDRLRVSFKPGN